MASKKFDHAVIYDGVFYYANTPIKVKDENEKPVKKAVKKDDKRTSE